MLDWIARLPRDLHVLDLGCGKLRHTIPLARRVAKVTAVDSREQIDREQSISGESGWTVRRFAEERCNNIRVFALDEPQWLKRRFDRVVIAYVLSAIPHVADRLEVLRQAKDVLNRRGGEILIATNFANSRFKDWEQNKQARRYRDGYLITNAHGTSFYGMITLDKLRDYAARVELDVISATTHHGENAYLAAGRR